MPLALNRATAAALATMPPPLALSSPPLDQRGGGGCWGWEDDWMRMDSGWLVDEDGLLYRKEMGGDSK